MPWFKVDDKLHSHVKVAEAGDAMALWVVAGSWCSDQLTDGFVPAFMVERLMPGGQDMARRLTEVGLWCEDEQDGRKGWRFHAWDEFQPTAEQVEEKREAGRERQERSRRHRAGDHSMCLPEHCDRARTGPSRTPDDVAGASVTRDRQRPDPTRPDPTTRTPTVAASGDDGPPDGDFDTFWATYPRGPAGKPGGDGPKKPTRTSWRRMTADQRTAALDAVGHYAAHVASADGPRAAHAATWLNQERWEQWSTPARASPDGPAPPDPTKAAADRARNLAAQPWNVVADLLASAGHTDDQIATARHAWTDAQQEAAA